LSAVLGSLPLPDEPALKPIGRPYLLALPTVLWLVVFAVVPLGFMLIMSFWTSSVFGTKPAFQFGNYARQLSEPLYGTLLLKTLRIAAITTLITAIISFPIAYLMTRMRGAWKSLLLLALFMPFWTSYVVRTFVWLPILGRNGAINAALLGMGVIDQPMDWMLYNEGTVYLGLVYVYTLFMTLPIYLSLDRIDRRLIEAALDLGARPFTIFRRILLPLSWPGILSGSIMVFLLAVGAYVTPRLLGGTSGIMYGNLIADQFLTGQNWAFGSALAITLVLIVVAALLVAGRWVGIRQVFTGGQF
jgi:spermidine/putrescine transport system permease protein